MKARHWIPVGGIAITALILFGLVIVDTRERDQALRSATQRNENLAVAMEQYTTRTLQTATLVARYIAAETKTQPPSVALGRLGTGGVFGDSLLDGVGVLDVNGRLAATAQRGAWPDLDLSEREHFLVHQKADSHRLFVGKPVQSALLNRIVVPLTMRINDSDGSFAGVVIVQISPGRLTEIYKSAQLVGEDFIAVIGLDGTVRARSTGGRESSGEDFRTANVFNQIMKAPTGSFVSPGVVAGMTRRYASYRVLKDYGLVVVVGASEKGILANYDQRSLYRRQAGLGFAMLMALLTWFTIALCKRRDDALAHANKSATDLRQLATHDHLTGLPNRILLSEMAGVALRKTSPLVRTTALLFIDLDNFKFINDGQGHALGDEVLKSVATLLEETLPISGTAFRLGGDEFVVLLECSTDPIEEAAECARGILAGLSNPILRSPVDITISASIGISLSHSADSLEKLLQHADAAMFAAKDGGRRTYSFYSEHMSREAGERLRLEQELRKALRLEQLTVVYQPKVDLRTGAPAGVEALLRWTHPELGMVPPCTFIPVAEDTGLIIEIGAWVLRQACLQVKKWDHEGLPNVPVAVNVSALQFTEDNFVAQVSDAMKAAGISPRLLELEMTESLLVQRPELASCKLEELRQLGVSIALDDFGTGYSNLHSVTKFPLNVLKLDKAFTADLPHDAMAISIAEAIITLGGSLGLSVVAEGIETREQADFLLSRGCAIGQGYLYSHPLPPDLCAKWLAINAKVLPALFRQVA
jgi:diguanylate cyclase (GGDEF)-like protein